VFVLVSARLRRALGALRIAVRDEGFPRWYLLAGTFGAVFALAQSTLTLLTGVAVFTVALLSGQAIGGLVVDAWGVGGGVRRRPECHRLVGVGIILVAAVISALPGFASTPDPVTVALPAAGASATGFLIGLQQAMNGATSAVSGSPAAATWVNFWGGSLFLAAAWGVKVLLRGPAEHPLPTDWWLYLGGLCGLVFIGFSALLVRRLGVLLLGMALTAGLLVSSLVLDVVVTSGRHAPSWPWGSPRCVPVIATLGGEGVRPGRLTPVPWEAELVGVIAEVGVAVHEERVVETLVGDLRAWVQ